MTVFKKGLPLFLIGVSLITLLDSIGSIASRELNFKYSYLFPLSLLIYVLIPFFITKRSDQKNGIIFAALLGLFDATVGWKISMILKANTGNSKNEASIFLWIVVAIIVTIFTTLLGVLSSWAALKIYKRKSTNR